MATYKVTVLGKFPSLNDLIAATNMHKHRGNQLKQKSQNEISYYILEQLRRVRIDKPVFIKYRFYEPNKKRDLDNIASYFMKVFQDSLVCCRIIPNDNWYHIVGFSNEFFVDNRQPRIEVELVEMERC